MAVASGTETTPKPIPKKYLATGIKREAARIAKAIWPLRISAAFRKTAPEYAKICTTINAPKVIDSMLVHWILFPEYALISVGITAKAKTNINKAIPSDINSNCLYFLVKPDAFSKEISRAISTQYTEIIILKTVKGT